MFVNDIYPRTSRLLALPPEEREELSMNFPMAIVSGDQDAVVPYKLMRDLILPAAASDDKELIKLKGKDHQPMLAGDWEDTAGQMAAWFARRAAAPST